MSDLTLEMQVKILTDALLDLTEVLYNTTHANEPKMVDLENRLSMLISYQNVNDEMKAEEPTREQVEEHKPEQAKTLDDVRAAVTQVMKADKTKKQALQVLLKKHGADRVSELDESKFAIVIDTIEKGEF
jgi:hypothetical protein